MDYICQKVPLGRAEQLLEVFDQLLVDFGGGNIVLVIRPSSPNTTYGNTGSYSGQSSTM